jgi:hypothetical protein
MARRKKQRNKAVNIFLALIGIIIISAAGVLYNFEGVITLILSFIGGLMIGISLKRNGEKKG